MTLLVSNGDNSEMDMFKIKLKIEENGVDLWLHFHIRTHFYTKVKLTKWIVNAVASVLDSGVGKWTTSIFPNFLQFMNFLDKIKMINFVFKCHKRNSTQNIPQCGKMTHFLKKFTWSHKVCSSRACFQCTRICEFCM